MNWREYLNSLKKIPKHDAKFGEILSDAAKWVDTTDAWLSLLQSDIEETKKIALQDMDKVEELDKSVTEIWGKVEKIQKVVDESGKKSEASIRELEKKHMDTMTSHETKMDLAIEWLKLTKADKAQVQADLQKIEKKIMSSDATLWELRDSLSKEIQDINEKPDKEIINDEISSKETTYSSDKIESMVKRQVNTVSYWWWASKIDDTVTTDNRTRSSTKIRQEINDSAPSGTWWSIIGTLSDQTDLQAALDDKSDISGTPVNNYVAIWTGATAIEWDANLQFDGTKLSVGWVDTMTVNWASITSHLAVHGSDGITETEIEMHRHWATAAWGVSIYWARSRGTAWSPTIVQSGDVLMSFTAVWYDWTDYATSSQISFEVDGTPWSNDMPWRILFNTSADWGQTLTERMRIKATWEVNISAASSWNTLVVDTSTLIVDAANHRVGIWTTAPTHALTFPVSSTGIALYNTVNQTTDYERFTAQWSWNLALIQTERLWTWVNRWIRIKTWAGNNMDWGTTPSYYAFDWSFSSTSTTPRWRVIFTANNSSWVTTLWAFAPTINQSWTAWYTALLINPTESATWSWTKLLQDWQVWSSSKAVVDNWGKFGFLTTVPTHTATFGSTSTWIALYNTADQTTNFERARIIRGSNIFQISAWSGWTWSTKTVRIGTASSGSETIDTYISISRWSPFHDMIRANSGTILNNWSVTRRASTIATTAGIATVINLSPTISQSSAAWYTVLDLNPTESATWSWAKNFLLCRKSSWSTIFGVSSVGDVTTTGIVSATWSITSTITGASSTVPVTITVDSSVATQTALLVQNATNYAHSWNLATFKLLNWTDSWAILKLENSGTGNYITADSVFSISKSWKATFDATITPALTTGNQTINKPSGTVNIAAWGTTVTVTNSLCTTSSLVYVNLRTNDTTATIKNVVPGSGSFVITLTAAATAEVSIWFLVVN